MHPDDHVPRVRIENRRVRAHGLGQFHAPLDFHGNDERRIRDDDADAEDADEEEEEEDADDEDADEDAPLSFHRAISHNSLGAKRTEKVAKTRATRERRTLESSYLTSVRNSVVVLGG